MDTVHFYHYATKGLESDLLFSSVKSFIAGMNRVALCYSKALYSFPLKIICFCLMDNHVHFIFHGLEENCDKFMNLFKKLTEIWLTNHPEEGTPGKKWEIGHWGISDKESLVEKINYVHRNAMAAGMAFTPSGYRWSTGNLLFSDKTFIKEVGRRIGDLGITEKRKMFDSKIQVPDEWIVLPDGIIWPGCYTEYRYVEKLFKGVVNYQYELNRHIEDKVNLEVMEDYVSLPDNEVRAKAIAYASELFGKGRISDLSVKQRQEVAKRLKKETGTSTKQISRIVRLKYEDLKLLI